MGLPLADTKRKRMVRCVNVLVPQRSREDSEPRQTVLETEIFLEQRRVNHQAAQAGRKYLLRSSISLLIWGSPSSFQGWLYAPEGFCCLTQGSGRQVAPGHLSGPDSVSTVHEHGGSPVRQQQQKQTVLGLCSLTDLTSNPGSITYLIE